MIEKYILRNSKGYAELMVYESLKFLPEDKCLGRPEGYYDVIRIDALKSSEGK